MELVDTRDLKSLARNSVPVQVRLRVRNYNTYIVINCITSGEKICKARYKIDVLEIFKVLWNSKILILSSVLIIFVISLIISLFLTNLYTSSALLEVEDYQNNSNMQGLSRYSGLASLAGEFRSLEEHPQGMIM